MATRAALVNRVLNVLGIVGATETASAEDYATANGYVDPTIARYNALGVALAGDTADLSDIPDAVILPLTYLIALECCEEFQIGGQKLQTLAQMREKAELDLRRIYRQAFSPRRLRLPHIGRRRSVYYGGQ